MYSLAFGLEYPLSLLWNQVEVVLPVLSWSHYWFKGDAINNFEQNSLSVKGELRWPLQKRTIRTPVIGIPFVLRGGLAANFFRFGNSDFLPLMIPELERGSIEFVLGYFFGFDIGI